MGAKFNLTSTAWQLALALMLGASALAPVARAAKAQEGAFFPVFVLACDAYVKMQGSAAGFGFPPQCRGLEGIKITVYDTEGAKLDDCRTSAEGNCRLAISTNGVRIYEQESENVPEGYRAEADVQRLFTYTEFAEVAFHNYSEAAFPQRDAPRATVRVHTRVCPDNYTGDTFFDDCDPGAPETNQWIFGNDEFARAGKYGDAILRDIPAATGSEIIGGQSLATGDVFFYCSLTEDASVRVPTSLEVTALYDGITRDFVGKVDLNPGDDVTCDWYQIPLLDRGLWDSVVNPLAASDPGFVSGNIEIDLIRCDPGYLPSSGIDVQDNCKAGETDGLVRLIGEDGVEVISSPANSRARALLELPGMPTTPFTITLDGHDNAGQDLIICSAIRLFPDEEELDPLIQATVIEGPGWSIPGYGDDVNGLSCTWYLAAEG